MEEAKKIGLESFRVGRRENCEIPTICVDFVLDDVVNQLYDEVGEVSESYLDNVTRGQLMELEEELNEVFYKWNKKYGLEPNFYRVFDIEVVKIEREE